MDLSPLWLALAAAGGSVVTALAARAVRWISAETPPPTPAPVVAAPEPPPQRSRTGSQPALTGFELRVLVVDDISAIRSGVAGLLGPHGDMHLRVDTAATSEEAERLLAAHSYAVEIWDLVPGTPRRPWRILHTGMDAVEAERARVELGFDRVVLKGVETEPLEDAVREGLTRG